MLNSFQDTKSETTRMVVYVSTDDSYLSEYKQLKYSDVEFIFGEHKWMSEVLNYISTEIYPNFSYYHEVNDDHIFQTRQWDKILINEIENQGGFGVACGKDLVDGTEDKDWYKWEHPSSAIISGNTVRLFECFLLPGLRQFGGDIYLKNLMKYSECLYYVPSVIIEHCTPYSGKSDMDESYKFIYEHDKPHAMNLLYKWRDSKMLNDINKLREKKGLYLFLQTPEFVL